MIDQSIDFCSRHRMSAKRESRGGSPEGFSRSAKFAYDKWVICARDRDGVLRFRIHSAGAGATGGSYFHVAVLTRT